MTLLVLLFVICAPLHLASKLLLGRSHWPPRFLGAAAWILGARVRRVGDKPRPNTLLLCNHVSWLDILVLGGATGCTFVSKDNLGHGFVHWLADQNDTIYVRREHRKGASGQAQAIREALERKKPVALFPEGTVGPGDPLLPFRSALLAAVTPAPSGVQVRPLAIDYGPATSEITWHGESGKDNVLRILNRKGTLPVTVHLLPPLARTDDRKALAHDARQAIGETLASSRASTPL